MQSLQRLYCADPLIFYSGYIVAAGLLFLIVLIKFIRFQVKNRRLRKARANPNMEKIEIRNESGSTNASSPRSASPKVLPTGQLNPAGRSTPAPAGPTTLNTPSPTPRRSRKPTPQITPRSDEEAQSLLQSEPKTDATLDFSNDKVILWFFHETII